MKGQLVKERDSYRLDGSVCMFEHFNEGRDGNSDSSADISYDYMSMHCNDP